MSGLMQRILRRRDRGAHAPEAPAHTEPAHPAPAGQPAPAAPAGAEAPTSTAAEPAPAAAGGAAPAGVDPAAVAEAGPSFRERGRLRRRLRFLRRLRELGFRDLGGLVFDQHRFGRPDDELVRGKLTALAAVDAELRALERALHDHVPITELREPGISACARCGAVIASDARFCSACGAPAGGARAIPAVGGPAAAAPEAAPAQPDAAAAPTAPLPRRPRRARLPTSSRPSSAGRRIARGREPHPHRPMSTTTDPGAIACPHCGRPVQGDQDWCLSCGAAARTRLARTPAWRVPLVVAAVTAVVALLLLTWAFVALTRDEAHSPAPQTAPAQP